MSKQSLTCVALVTVAAAGALLVPSLTPTPAGAMGVVGPANRWIPTSVSQVQQQEEEKQTTEKTTEKPRAKPRRLPTYYARVVTQQQREEIYQIQDRFEEEIMAIQAQLEAKIEARDVAVEAVLEPEQLAEVKRLLAEAAKRRESRTSGKSGSDPEPSGKGDGR